MMNLMPEFIKNRFDLLLPIVLASGVLVIAIAYWDGASSVTPSDCDAWPNGCSGDYLPWPIRTTHLVCTQVRTPMDSIDRLVCGLVKTQLYIPLIMAQIAATVCVGRFVARQIFPPLVNNSEEIRS